MELGSGKKVAIGGVNAQRTLGRRDEEIHHIKRQPTFLKETADCVSEN